MEANTTLFAKLRSELEAYLPTDKIEQIYQSFLYAAHAHEGQTRRSGEPYIIHPVATCRILAAMHMDEQTITAAMLHDVIEDTDYNKADLSNTFGEDVAELVDGVSKLTQIEFENQEQAQAENFRKMALAMVQDIRVIIIKLADRLHNMRTLMIFPRPKRQRIATETLEIYAPIANRLGMHKFVIELEDLCFAAIYPLRHRAIHAAIENLTESRDEALGNMKNAIIQSLEARGIETLKLSARVKHPYGIYQKMLEKHLSFSEVMDVYAFRIIVNNEDDCYRALGAAHSLYKPLPAKFKDYIAIPKANGYQSLHTILFGPGGLPIEIQVRTAEMDQMSENGVAAHWLYKTLKQDIDVKPHMRAQQWLKRLMEMQTQAGSSMEFIEEVKIDLFPDEVYVFTPKGNILELPAGATPVDFAYAIHSDIGNNCVAAKVDRRLAPLSAKLMNGQSVEIITAPEARPNPAWLNFIVTGKARNNIRHFIKSQRRAESIELGRHLLEEALGGPVSEIDEMAIYSALKETHHKTLNDLLEAIGLGNQVAQLVARRLSPLPEETHAELDNEVVNQMRPILIKGSEGMLIEFADCCCPVPGDRIIGVLTSGRGLVVHHAPCLLLEKYHLQPEKIIPVRWEDEIQGEFKVDVFVEMSNQRGVLAKLAEAISHADANIDNIHVKEGDGRYKNVRLTLTVSNRVHLARVMRKIRAIRLVSRIRRCGI